MAISNEQFIEALGCVMGFQSDVAQALLSRYKDDVKEKFILESHRYHFDKLKGIFNEKRGAIPSPNTRKRTRKKSSRKVPRQQKEDGGSDRDKRTSDLQDN